MISDEVADDVAELFTSISGYTIDEEDRKPVDKVVAPAPTKRGQKKVQEPKAPESAPKADEPAAEDRDDADANDSGEVF